MPTGLCNKVFIKLMTFPLYNYPVFVNLMSSFIYIPTSFAYILPMYFLGRVSKAERNIPQVVFFTMGGLDALAGIMQLFATNFIKSGSLLILLSQSSIPITMIISRFALRAKYTRSQVAGAVTVVVGIAVILMPSFRAGDPTDACHAIQCSPVLWSAVLVLSCVPMCLSTVYKERALAKVDIDPIFLNGFVSVYQFMISIPLSIPAAPFTGVAVRDVGRNAVDGWRCYIGINSVTEGAATALRPADDCWPSALVFASAYLVANQMYNILIILMLKYGSASLLYLAMTLLVPLGNVAFALPFMPNAQPLTASNLSGLLVIMLGLFFYRFLDKLIKRHRQLEPPPRQTAQDQIEKARRAAVVMGSPSGIFAIESLHTLIDDVIVTSPQLEHIGRSPQQIRASYLLKLGLRHPSPGPSPGPASPLLDASDADLDDPSDGGAHRRTPPFAMDSGGTGPDGVLRPHCQRPSASSPHVDVVRVALSPGS